jgi:hypothetical protein
MFLQQISEFCHTQFCCVCKIFFASKVNNLRRDSRLYGKNDIENDIRKLGTVKWKQVAQDGDGYMGLIYLYWEKNLHSSTFFVHHHSI